jgi:hypothetical protein
MIISQAISTFPSHTSNTSDIASTSQAGNISNNCYTSALGFDFDFYGSDLPVPNLSRAAFISTFYCAFYASGLPVARVLLVELAISLFGIFCSGGF